MDPAGISGLPQAVGLMNSLFVSTLTSSISLHKVQSILILFLSHLSTTHLHLVMAPTAGRSYGSKSWVTFSVHSIQHESKLASRFLQSACLAWQWVGIYASMDLPEQCSSKPVSGHLCLHAWWLSSLWMSSDLTFNLWYCDAFLVTDLSTAARGPSPGQIRTL